MSLLQRALAPVAEIRRDERTTALLMFCYSFLAMAGYNMVKPATRSQFINSLGADNLPYVQLVAGLIMGFIIQGYTAAMRLLPRRWVFAATQVVMVALLVVFWFLFRTEQSWVSVAFYLWGILAGSLLISQFWSLANDIYNARQAKRLFGFIGGGSSLGGMVGAGVAGYAKAIGTNNLLLLAAVTLAICFIVVWAIAARNKPAAHDAATPDDDKSMSLAEAVRLLVASRHFRVIALVISFAAIGAGIIEQQLNMSVEELIPGRDARTAFLGNVIFYSSLAGFFIQMTATTRVHRLLGIGFALLLLPTSLGATGVLILLVPALWTTTTARVLDTSLRYTVDKTTREILFMPLPTAMKYKAKPFADVAVDRFAKGVGAALALIIAIKVFHLTWWNLSYLSVGVTALWVFMALRARAEYLHSFRRSLNAREIDPAELRLNAADLSTIETLVQELARPDADRVVYAIDVLESLDKRHLVTPLLLYHDSPAVRRRALGALAAARCEVAQQWVPQVRRLLSDADAGVRVAAIRALGAICRDEIAELARPMLADADPRIRVAAAVALASSAQETDVDLAERALLDVAGNGDEAAADARRDVAAAIRQIPDPRFRRMLIPLLHDPVAGVANEAMESVRAAGAADFMFVPALVALLRNRQLKGQARRVLMSYGEPVVEILAHFLRDPEEDTWVRRHIPATLAQIPSQRTVDVLLAALDEPDRFLRFKVIAALERVRREGHDLQVPPAGIEALLLREARTYFDALSLHDNLAHNGMPRDSLLARALAEKQDRAKDRVYRLLSLIYPWKDVAAARWTLEHGDARGRAAASEYLDNLLAGPVRKHVMPIVEDLPVDERVRRGNVLLRTRPRDAEETLLRLINDDDQVIAATAIDAVARQKMWTLADDIEYVLAHRDVRDWYVFEAASWALAEHRVTAERRRRLWLEPLPAAELAGRLRQLPLFASVSVDELFRIVSAARQTRHEIGVALMAEGAIPDTLHLLLDGRVSATAADGPVRLIDGCAALGIDEALQGQPMGETIRTADVTVTLALTADELLTLLSDNTDLVSGLFATMVQCGNGRGQAVTRTSGETTELEAIAHGSLATLDKVLALRRVPLFARLSPEEMPYLGSIAHRVFSKAGEQLFDETARPAIWLVLAGDVALESATGGAPARATAGDVMCLPHTMAGCALERRARATTDGVLLKIDRDELFDLLGDRSAMLRQIFAALFREVGRPGRPAAV